MMIALCALLEFPESPVPFSIIAPVRFQIVVPSEYICKTPQRSDIAEQPSRVNKDPKGPEAGAGVKFKLAL